MCYELYWIQILFFLKLQTYKPTPIKIIAISIRNPYVAPFVKFGPKNVKKSRKSKFPVSCIYAILYPLPKLITMSIIGPSHIIGNPKSIIFKIDEYFFVKYPTIKLN